jgi:hypothetical protein
VQCKSTYQSSNAKRCSVRSLVTTLSRILVVATIIASNRRHWFYFLCTIDSTGGSDLLCIGDILLYPMFFCNRMFDLLLEPSTLFGDLLGCLVSVVVLSIGVFLSWRGSPDIPRTLFATSPVYISVRKSKGSLSVERITLRDFVESKIPSLYLPFVPAWWLFK